jgi:hypothetical protein
VTQESNTVAIGTFAGRSGQQSAAIAVGLEAGQSGQGIQAIAIGKLAGESTQLAQAIAMGASAGQSGQGTAAIAVGIQAGQSGQGASAVAIGTLAGFTSQGNTAVAVGNVAGRTSQGNNAVAVGHSAGFTGQKTGAVAIGYRAGMTDQVADSIVIYGNSSETALNAPNAGLYIKPIRSTFVVSNVLTYASGTGEITDTGSFKVDSIGNVTLTRGLITNTDEVTKKTYSYKGPNRVDIGHPNIVIKFSNHLFSAKITAHSIISSLPNTISTLIVDVTSGITVGPLTIFGNNSSEGWNTSVITTADTIELPSGVGASHIFIEYISGDPAGKVVSFIDGMDEIDTNY